MTQAEQPAIGRQRFERPAGHPMMVRESAFEASFPKASSFWDDDEPTAPKVERYGSAALIRVTGPLTHHAEWWFDSYDAISSRLDAALAATPRPTSIVMVLDTPGGDASGCFELAASMRKRCAAARVPLVAYVEGMACSAGYALACAADRIVSSPSSIVGSIGVVTGIVDYTGALAMCGVKVRLIKSGARKTDGSPYEPTSREAEDSIQGLINSLASLFFAHVGSTRPKAGGPEGVAALEAGVFLGAQGVSLGLVDEVGTLDTAIAVPRPAPTPAPAPAPAEASRRASVAIPSPRARRGTPEKRMTKPISKPRLEGENTDDENKDDAAAEMEQADFARARTATEMPDASAQEVLDMLVDSYEGNAEGGDDSGEQAKRAAVAEAALTTATGKLTALSTRVAELEKVAAKSAKRDRDDAVGAALGKRGLSSQADRERFTALADKHGLEAALASIESSGPPSGSVSGSASAASVGAAADAVSVGSDDAKTNAVRAEAAGIKATNPSWPDHKVQREAMTAARMKNPSLFATA